MSKTNLSVHILREFHGDLISKIGECLMKCGTASLKYLTSKAGVPVAKVQSALQVLIQHGVVHFSVNSHGMTEYGINVHTVLYRLHFPKVVQCAGHLYGDGAEMIVEELLYTGQAKMEDVVATITDRLNVALKAQGEEEVQPSRMLDKFERLVATHFIKRCAKPLRNDKGAVVGLTPHSLESMFALLPKTRSGAVRVKSELAGREEPPPAKRARLDQDSGQSSQDKDGEAEVYWEINHPRFLHHFRDQALVAAVTSRLDSEKAGEVMRTILRLCEVTTDPEAPFSHPVSFVDIQSQLPRDLGMTTQVLEQWLKIITAEMPEFLSKSASSGGGMYTVNVFQALQALCTAHIESVVEERFGSKSLRIFRVILQKKQVEQNTVEKCVLMPAKEAKELLYRMFKEHFVHITELAKTPDHAPSRTYYLFNVNTAKVARLLLERSYKAMKNLLIKRRLVHSENKRLLDREERIRAIISSLKKDQAERLGAQGEEGEAPMELSEDQEQELKAIEDMITPPERQLLTKIRTSSNHLESSELELHDTILLLEAYLAMTYHPPPPKQPKDWLKL